MPPTSQQIGHFPLKRVKYQHGHPFIFISSSFTGEFSALNQSEAMFAELGGYSQKMLSEDFWTPTIALTHLDE